VNEAESTSRQMRECKRSRHGAVRCGGPAL